MSIISGTNTESGTMGSVRHLPNRPMSYLTPEQNVEVDHKTELGYVLEDGEWLGLCDAVGAELVFIAISYCKREGQCELDGGNLGLLLLTRPTRFRT